MKIIKKKNYIYNVTFSENESETPASPALSVFVFSDENRAEKNVIRLPILKDYTIKNVDKQKYE